jgi:hypothetical protein
MLRGRGFFRALAIGAWSGVRLGRACSGIGRLLGLQAAAPDSTGINGVVAPHAGVMMHLVGGGRGWISPIPLIRLLSHSERMPLSLHSVRTL